MKIRLLATYWAKTVEPSFPLPLPPASPTSCMHQEVWQTRSVDLPSDEYMYIMFHRGCCCRHFIVFKHFQVAEILHAIHPSIRQAFSTCPSSGHSLFSLFSHPDKIFTIFTSSTLLAQTSLAPYAHTPIQILTARLHRFDLQVSQLRDEQRPEAPEVLGSQRAVRAVRAASPLHLLPEAFKGLMLLKCSWLGED